MICKDVNKLMMENNLLRMYNESDQQIKSVLYLAQVRDNVTSNFLLKYGYTYDLIKRIKQHRKYLPEFVLIGFQFVDNSSVYEKIFANAFSKFKIQRKFENRHHKCIELLNVNPDMALEQLETICRNANNANKK